MYIYCVVCYRVIAAPYVWSVDHVFVYLYALDDDSERPMDYDTALFAKMFSFYLRCRFKLTVDMEIQKTMWNTSQYIHK